MSENEDKKVITYIETTTPPETRERGWQRMKRETLVRDVIEAIRENADLRREFLQALGLEDTP